ncbi:MAG: acetate--CoA ligase family protein [Xenococcaceae cyanobacterium MO_167.B27]|nr:acetate--CoA ligase family protein [Xenococcaceae cyanobacterium MO_167.B27]
MDLLEYQAKELFHKIGIPVLPSQTIKEPRELKQLQIPYPVVLKSQVKAGGRGKAGGIKFVGNTIDAIAAARNIFNLSILGEYPKVILAEAQYDVQEELFLAVVLDYKLKLPVLLGSAKGGMDVSLLLDSLQQVVVTTEFSPFYARRLVAKMGLSGELIQSVSKIIVKMYRIFQETDLDFVEINPLGVNAKGKLMALDGKIKINDYGLIRHAEISSLMALNNLSFMSEEQISLNYGSKFPLQWLDWQDDKGKIAIVANNPDLVTLCWDLIRQNKEKPACGVILPKEVAQLNGAENLCIKLQQALEELHNIPRLKVIILNIWASPSINDKIAQKILDYYRSVEKPLNPRDDERSLIAKSQEESTILLQTSPGIKLVVRLADPKIDRFRKKSDSELLYWTNNLKDAVNQAISWVKSK